MATIRKQIPLELPILRALCFHLFSRTRPRLDAPPITEWQRAFRALVDPPKDALPPVPPAPSLSDRPTALMLSFDHLLCLIVEAPPSSAALQQAVSLACSLGATLHVGRTESVSSDAVDKALHAAEGAVAGPSLPDCWDTADGPHGSLDALAAYVHDNEMDLVITDTPPDRGPIPLLSVPHLQRLVTRLDCSVLVVAQQTPLPTPERILVPTDLSPATRPALEHALALAAPGHTTIDLLHVLETVPYVALNRMDRLSLSHTSFPERRARRQMTAFLDDHDAPDIPVEFHVEYGDPADQIGRFLNHHPTDLLILPAHGAHASSDAPLGPVADRVLRRVACPLLLLRPTPEADAATPPPTPR